MHIVLLPGAGGVAGFWNWVTPTLEAAGHTVRAVDLPGDDPNAGLEEYAALTIAALGDAAPAVLVAQSMGGFTAAMVAARVPLAALIFVNAMIPAPGETPADWWVAVDQPAAQREAARLGGYSAAIDAATYFFHDVPADAQRALEASRRDEAEAAFASPCRFERWPAIPLHVLAGADDRLFPLPLQQRVARERLGVEAAVVPGGHLCAMSHPGALAQAILARL